MAVNTTWNDLRGLCRPARKPSPARGADPLSCRGRRAAFEVLEDRSLLTILPSLLSVNALGSATGNGESSTTEHSLSADGRYEVFTSSATDLVSGIADTNGYTDVFLRDLQTGVTTLVSVNSAGTATGNSQSSANAISADGRYVAFWSFASDLTDIPTSGNGDIFVRDLQAGTTTLVSINSDGTAGGNDYSYEAAISADGSVVAFASSASNLDPGVTNPNSYKNVYLRNWQAPSPATTMLSVNNTGTTGGNGDCLYGWNAPVISATGGTVVFESLASDLVSGGVSDGNNAWDVFARVLTAPTDVTSTMANGSYSAGAVVLVDVTFSRPVTVTGTPKLALNSGGTASYTSGSGTNTLVFAYTVAAGQNSVDLDYTSSVALTLNGGTITDVMLYDAMLTLPAPGTAGSLGANKNIIIDTTPPTADIADVTPDPRSTSVDAIRIEFSEPVSGLDLGDLSLTRDGGGNLLTASQTLTTSDNITWQLGNSAGLTGIAGSYAVQLSSSGSSVTDLAGNPLAADASDAWTTNSAIAGRHLFYNNSKFDGNDPAAGAADDGAIAPDKEALLPGRGTAAFKNYTTFYRGINGIMIDVAGLPGTTLAAADFTFKYGNDSTPGDWLPAANPTTIAVRAGAGTNGSDRVTLVWADKAIPNGNWLQVTALANANTGLAANDVFYFGCAIGETGNTPADAVVNSSDVTRTRNNFSGFNLVGLESVYDFNRDRQVASGDVTIARNHFSGFTPLELITPPASAPGPLGGAPLVAAPVLAAESQAASSGTPAATGLAECSATAHDAIFSQNLDRWDPRLAVVLQDPAHHAGCRRPQLDGRLVGLDLDEELVPIDPLALLLEPTGDLDLADRLADVGND